MLSVLNSFDDSFLFWGKEIETESTMAFILLTLKVCPEMMQPFNIDEKLAYREQLCFHSFKLHSLLLNILARRQIVLPQQFENPLSLYRPAVSSRSYSFRSRPEASCVRTVNLSWKPSKFSCCDVFPQKPVQKLMKRYSKY